MVMKKSASRDDVGRTATPEPRRLPDDFESLLACARESDLTEKDFLHLDILDLKRWELLEGAGAVLWGSTSSIGVVGRRTSVLLVYSTAAGEEIQERVAVEWRDVNYGGSRPWFRCPACARRVGKLYGPRPFVCRHCAGFTYSSTRKEPWERKLDRAQEIRERLGGSANMSLPFPPRPPRMHRRTYDRLRSESTGLYIDAMREALASITGGA